MAKNSESIRTSGANPIGKADGKNSGFTIEPGPYEAIVQGYVQSSRLGQLIVTIPDFSAPIPNTDQGIKSDQIVASYASPFFGTTYGSTTGLNPNTPVSAGQSYGFWFVPPDIGTTVLVIFAGGDIGKCYWFACAYNNPNHHMVPGIGRHVGGANGVGAPGDQISSYIGSNSVLPVVEADLADPALWGSTGLVSVQRYPHEYQTMVLAAQGLDRDPIRGAISSSSMREAPSNVYGISTPGRKATSSDQVSGDSEGVVFRTGGHSFVMDDGANGDSVTPAGTDQLIRLRTGGGHQILMNDTEHILYISSDSGRQWLEFSADGSINMYGFAGFNVRSEGPMNLHSDVGILMNAPVVEINGDQGIKITSAAAVSIGAGGAFTASAGGIASVTALGACNLAAGGIIGVSAKGLCNISGSLINLNGGFTGSPGIPAFAKTKPNYVASYDGKNWVADQKFVDSICTVVPGHEPWTRPGGSK